MYVDENSHLDEPPRKALESSQLANYFRHYIGDVALWYDLSDAGCFFSTEIPVIALDEPVLFCAIIALSAMHVSQTTAPSARNVAEMYHRRCVRYLINLSPDDELIEKGVALATTCLLRSYEILAGEVALYSPSKVLIADTVSLSQRTMILIDISGELSHWLQDSKLSLTTLILSEASLTLVSGTISARISHSACLGIAP